MRKKAVAGYSGGKRQRAALARAIVSRPRILLLDEPLAALDLRLRQQMQHTLVALQKELGIAFMYVTHDQGEALSMSDRVCVLADGKIAQLGTPREIYFSPQNEFVARFVGRSNLVPIDFRRAGADHVGMVGGQEVDGLRSSQGGGARMAIRYEAVQLTPLAAGAPPAPGSLRGTVEDVLFLGTSLEVNVQSNGINLFGTVPASQEPTFSVGQEVQVSFDIQNARVFHD